MATKAQIAREDKKWRAQDDARTLAEAQSIKKDPARMKAAVQEAKKMADDEAARAQSLRKVANLNPVRRTVKK